MKPFLEAAEAGGLLFDGAIGSLLYERGVFLTHCFENVSLEQPELVRRIHEEYLQAGARAFTTNTFAANRLKLARHGLADKVEAINTASVRIAREASAGRAYVCGSIGPTGTQLKDLAGPTGRAARAALAEQIDCLLAAGVDALIFETHSVLQELEAAIELARARTKLPVIALFTFQPDGRSLQKATPEQVGRRLVAAGADIIGSNCGGGPDLLYHVTTPMVGLGKPVMAQANAGLPQVVDGRAIYVANPDYFGVFARRLLKAGVKVIGGCCGTNPEHIRRMANATRMLAGGIEPPPPPRIEPGNAASNESRPEVPLAERSAFAAAFAAGRFVTSVEINPPNGLELHKKIEQVRALRDFGVTTINIADGPRASLNMSNLAMAVEVEKHTGVSPILHVCCRDRNFLGLQSHLLGAHVLGIHNLVVITGDPPKMGPYPHATGVYDVDSVGLLNVITGFNRGIDPAGKPMEQNTAFFCATGAEPAAVDIDREIRRLELKKAAGAHLVMTQPVYDPRVFERFLEDTAHLGLPVMVGLCPLASHRNALFLHQNVPGMQIPDYILRRMEQADARNEGQAEGVRIAREALESIRDRVQGAYIMPPFGRHKVAMEVLEGFL